MRLPRGYISYNQIRIYKSCPLKYYYKYIEEKEGSINKRVYTGLIFHSVLEFCFKNIIKGINLSFSDLRDLYLNLFKDKKQEYKIVDLRGNSEKEKNRGLNMLKYFYNNILLSINPLMVEKELLAKLPSGIILKGIVDLLDKDYSIIDFKTSVNKWSKSKINYSLIQMEIYKYLVLKNFNVSSPTIKYFIFIAKNMDCNRCQSLSIDDTSDLYVLEDNIYRVAQEISKGNFPQIPGKQCNYCFFSDICTKKMSVH